MREITLISPCKLNLFLYITGKRTDGFHNLQSLFCMTDYGDLMTFRTEESDSLQIRLTPDFGFPAEENLIFKACKLFAEKSGKTFRAHIHTEKRIPQGGGLGGGSSNAATTLLTLNTLLQANLSKEELCILGAELGSDVPFFIGGTHAFVEGRGEILHPVDESLLPYRHFTVVTPPCRVSTKEIFTDPELPRFFSTERSFETLLSTPFRNDFIPIVIKKFCDIGQVLDILIKYGNAAMSGTGASCFASFESREKAEKAAAELKAQYPQYRVFAASAENLSSLSPLNNR